MARCYPNPRFGQRVTLDPDLCDSKLHAIAICMPSITIPRVRATVERLLTCIAIRRFDTSTMQDSSIPTNASNGDDNVATKDATHSLSNMMLTSPTKTNGLALVDIHLLLPPEIIAEIFMSVCDYVPQRQPPRLTSPLVLGRVCGAWRELCWSTPSLWEVVDLLVVPARRDEQNELLVEWLARAGSRNLHIYLTEEEPHRGWKSTPPHKIMQTIASFSHQWETADIFLPEENYVDLAPIKDNLPVLKSLSIRPPKQECIELDLRIFENCPLLWSLDLGHYYLENVFLPWKQLTRLYADGLLIEECFKVFRECDNLITCHFDKIISDVEEIVTLPVPIAHRGIESFDVTNSEVQDIASVFGSVTLPSLKKLQITCSDWTANTTPPLLASFFSRSSCKLQHLIFNRMFPLETDLIKILGALPSLVHLAVEERDFEFSVEFMDLLCCPDPTYLFLPNLEVLTMYGQFSFTIHDMQRMLECRLKSGKITTLKSFSVVANGSCDLMKCELNDEVASAIRDMIENGLDFSVTIPDSPLTWTNFSPWLRTQPL